MRRKKISGGSPSSASDSNPPEPSGVFQGETSLAGIEDLSSGSDDQGVPFILVDSAVVYTRSDLDAALTLVEKRRMDTVEADSAANHMLLLEDESPPPELDLPINLGSRDAADLKAAEDEKRFQEDLKSLCLTTFSRKEKNALITTVSISTENLNRSKAPESFVKESRLLTQTCTNLEQIRLKLEQLKKQQDAIMVAEAVPEPPKGRPSIRRQATFDIKRESGGAASRHTISHPVIGVNAKDSLKNTQPQNSTKTPISIDTPSSRSSGSPMPSPLGFQQIINQIGDLLMQLQLQQEDTHTLEDGSSYSYMVTMVPRGSVAKCSVQVITDLKLPYRKAVVQPQGRSISSQLPTSRTPIINIYSPSGTRLESSQLPLRSQASQLSVKAPKLECSVLPFSHAIPSSPPEAAPCRIKSPYMRKRPGTYLKVPAPARLCHGKKRD
ncbi:hypothetical protein KR074_000393 [Drosophila pseudoananassae]|nr:hypothetical protein KR074_000393 [Drosophila pseudoananassae]